MTGARMPRFAFWITIAALISATTGAAQTGSANDAVTLTPAVVVAGSPELICVRVPAGATVDGEWLGQKLEFFRGRDGQAWYALAGVDVKGPVGSSSLRISARLAGGTPIDLSRAVEILPAHYRTSTLTVAPKFVEPGPDGARADQNGS